MSNKLRAGQFVDPKGAIVEDKPNLALVAVFDGTPTASVGGYTKGCLAVDRTNGRVYFNSGTTTSSTWTRITDTVSALTVTDLTATNAGVSNAAVTNESLTGTLTFGNGANIATNTGNGTQIATASGQKIGFWGATPIVRPATNGEANGYLGNAATNTNAGTFTANGNTGSTAYTLGDLVKHFKNMGILPS